jgi:hypothetical protein
MRINEAMDFESNDRTYDFGIMQNMEETFIILKVMWFVNYDAQTQEEFCEMNGIPISFFNKTIK